MKKHLLFPPLAALSFLLCAFAASPAAVMEENPSMNLQFVTDIAAEGSGSLSYEVTLSSEMIVLLKTFNDVDTATMCEDMFEYAYSDWEQSQKESGGDVTCSAKKTFADLDELESLVDTIASGASFDRLEIQDGKLYYDLALNVQGSSFEEFFGDEVNIDVTAFWVLKVPGEVVETNADTKSGQTLKWDMMKLDSSDHVKAEVKIGGGGLMGLDPTVTIIAVIGVMGCCCLVLIVIGVAVFFFLRRKKEAPAAAA